MEIDRSRRREISSTLPPRKLRSFTSEDQVTVCANGRLFTFKGNRVFEVDDDNLTLTSGRIVRFKEVTVIDIGPRNHPLTDSLTVLTPQSDPPGV